MTVTPEQRRRIRPALAELLDEADEDAATLLARAYAAARAIAPAVTVEELAVLLTGLRDLTAPSAG